MMNFKNREGKIIIENIITEIKKNKEYLSEIDGAIGDGDHGINMNKGFTMTEKKLKGKNTNLTEALKTLGFTLVNKIGGSMGPLYGNFFLKMSKTIAENEEINKKIFGNMIKSAQKGVKSLGNAKVGDKTMIDTLTPAVKAYNQALERNKDFDIALEDMQKAAEKGKNSTKNLIAKVGRSARLGKRSKGVLDAGAVSCNIILQTMAESIKKLINKEENHE